MAPLTQRPEDDNKPNGNAEHVVCGYSAVCMQNYGRVVAKKAGAFVGVLVSLRESIRYDICPIRCFFPKKLFILREDFTDKQKRVYTHVRFGMDEDFSQTRKSRASLSLKSWFSIAARFALNSLSVIRSNER